MMKKIIRYFDKLEDRIRGRLSRYPILYTLIGGIAIVLFWRGVWITADSVSMYLPPGLYWLDGPISIVVSVFTLLATGLFVSFFVNDQIILSGVKSEKKLIEKTETEIAKEEGQINVMIDEIRKLEIDIQEMKHTQ